MKKWTFYIELYQNWFIIKCWLYKWDYLNLPMLFEGQLNKGVLAVLVGTWLLVHRCWVQVNNDFCTTGCRNERMVKKNIEFYPSKLN